MSRVVLDSSAVLAAIFAESGGEKVAPLLSGGIVSAVNVGEILSKLSERGMLNSSNLEDFDKLGLEIVNFDREQAIKAAELRQVTKHLGLSLGDRCCLALAVLRKATAVTADRTWKGLKVCRIEVVR